MWEMTETGGCLDSHRSSSAELGRPSSSYRPRLPDRLWSRVFEGLSRLFWARFDSHSLLCPACPIRTAYCQQLRQGHFLAQWLTFATKKANSMWSFFDAHYLLWSRLVLPGKDISHCHKKKEPMLLKHLKCHVLQISVCREVFKDDLAI